MGIEHVSGFKFSKGDQIGKYTILDAFEPGGFAFAGKARDNTTGKNVFFKKYKSPGAASDWYDAFVVYQGKLKDRIQSTVPSRKLCYEFLDFFEMKMAGGRIPKRAFYQVFEWIENGKDLRGFLDDPETFDLHKRVTFARVMVAGVKAIHQSGIIHADLKPENFYLVPAKTPIGFALRVIDMDFSLIDGLTTPWHGKQGYVGTPGYMSPEHLNNQVPIKASDVFTCGLILGELLGERHPSGDDMENYDERAKAGRLTPITIKHEIDGVPNRLFLSKVINAALHPDATKRPTSEQLLDALYGKLHEFDGKRPTDTISPPPLTTSEKTPVAPTHKPLPVPTVSPALKEIEIIGPAGQTLSVKIGGVFGVGNFRNWFPGDCEKFMVSEQFRLFKDTDGNWLIQHGGIGNITTANNSPLNTAMRVEDGMIVALGKSGKCPMTLKLR